jgi:hypothetical protein
MRPVWGAKYFFRNSSEVWLTLSCTEGTRGNFDQIQSPEDPMVNAQREPSPEEIERLANELWQARGSPYGSTELDWLKAEQILRDRKPSAVTRSKSHPPNAESERRDEVRASRSVGSDEF